MAALDVLNHSCAINTSEFAPTSSVILAILQTNPVIIVTSQPFNFVNGTIVRLSISPNCGMQQINQQTGVVTVAFPNTFTLPIDASKFDAFVVPELDNTGFAPQGSQPCSYVIPIGELTQQLNMAVHNVLG